MTEPAADGGAPAAEALSPAAVQRGAVRGMSLLVGRTLLVQLVTGVATIALARLLAPRDYGAFAIAQAAQLLGRSAVEVGLPLALIRREAPPTVAELRSVTGFMLAAAVAIAAAALLVAFVALPAAGVDSRVVRLVAVTCLALPLYGVRAVPMVLIERRLAFSRLVAVEVSETLSFYVFAIPGAVAGLAAYSLAGGVPVAAAVGAVVAFAVQRWSFGLGFDWAVLRPLARFGVQVSVLYPIQLVREVTLTALFAAAGGQSLAGFYALAQRLFSVATAIRSAALRVAVTALARGDAGEGREASAVRAVAVTSVAVGLPMALVVGAADPLIAVLFGHRWLPAADVVTASAAGMFLLTGVGAVLSGLALADGDARSPLIAGSISAAVSIGLAFALVEPLGATGAGLANGAGLAIVAAGLLWRASPAVRRSAWPALRTLAVAAVAAAAGRVAPGGEDPAGLALALGVSLAAWIGLSLVASRAEAMLLVRLLRRHVIPGVRRRATAPGS